MNSDFWRNRKVFITGHTGFKGGWMALWLVKNGAKVYGYSLAPPTSPNFFLATKLEKKLSKSFIGDICNLKNLSSKIKLVKPSIIIHMAAQSIVGVSYDEPINTFKTNIIGTVNILEAARNNKSVKALINITSDKCYEVVTPNKPFKETDRLGGFDPYSSSKACSELVTSAYKKSFSSEIGIASARAGNVIGGGDWAKNRLLPDFFRSFHKNRALHVRSPNFIRPWQHVLEPISGYLLLAEKLITNKKKYSQPWNFGPSSKNIQTVSQIIKKLKKKIKKSKFKVKDSLKIHETKLLQLNSSKSISMLNWKNYWEVDTALYKTIDWYHAWKKKEDMMKFSLSQINSYENLMKKKQHH